VLRYLWDYGTFFAVVAMFLAWLHIKHRFDVIQVNTMPDSLVFATVIPRLLGARVTLFMKEPVPELYETIYTNKKLISILRTQEQWAMRYAHVVFTVTGELRARFIERGADASKIHVVLNGPDGRNLLDNRRERCGPDPDLFTIVCNGTIEDRYGHDVLLWATRAAIEADPRIRIRITGSGTAMPRVERMVQELGLSNHVSLLGWLPIEELVCELDRADAGVIPMKASPYSHLIHTNKMYDYTLFGKPVIASRLRSVDDYFDDGAICFFTPDDPSSLATAMVRLAADPSLCENLAAKAMSLLETDYGWDHQKAILVNTTLEALQR
jgi:glycosyltransferase involved in cell wall biosynthesis